MFSREFEAVVDALEKANSVLDNMLGVDGGAYDSDIQDAKDDLSNAENELNYIRDNMSVDTDNISSELSYVENKVAELADEISTLDSYVADVRRAL